MKNFIIIILTLIVIALVVVGIGYFTLTQKGYDYNSIQNLPNTVSIEVDCSDIRNLGITSTVNVIINNRSSNQYNNVMVEIQGYDQNGNLVKSKTTTFDRTLHPNGTLSKPITLPAKVRRCNCIVANSN